MCKTLQITKCKRPVNKMHTHGEAIVASHYVTGAAHPQSLILQRRRRPLGRPWPGHVLGRFINDTWLAPAGPLHRPVRPHFSGPGRVSGQIVKECYPIITFSCCVAYFQTGYVSLGSAPHRIKASASQLVLGLGILLGIWLGGSF